jgi:D-alanyl-D-alanine carboxypeptidase/D-alanyl-D-alanine-endopeptidase (penicillin-binding protein 4)
LPSLVRSIVVALLAIAAAVVAANALADPSRVSPGTHAVASLSTPLWSPRRVPDPIVDTAEPPRFTAALMPAVSGFDNACFAVVSGTRYLAEYHDDAPLTPASTQKLLTAAGALAVLGPDRTFTTNVVADGDPATGSVSRLWIVGGGDPVLATAPYAEAVSTPLESLADDIVAAGVREVTGGIAGDDSRYTDVSYLPTWQPSYREKFEVGPVAALTVNDGIPLVGGKPVVVDDPAAYAAAELSGLLRARGVRVVGQPSHETAPANAVAVASVTSKPLRDILAAMLDTSDNLTAEMLTREVGVVHSAQGTTAAGTAAILDTLRRMGVPLDGVVMDDGSGLDRSDRLTCRALVGALALADRPGFDVLSWSLPAAGIEHAKGGYLDGVTGLAGFLDVERPLRFAVLLNGNLSAKPNDDLQRFVNALEAAPRLPPADELVPWPRAPQRGEVAER